jgi:hypothetical protein
MTGAAACILTAVLAANQAAALPAASVPYLLAQGPVPLRFARPRPVAPPPRPPAPPPVEVVAELKPAPDPAASAPEPTPSAGPPEPSSDPAGNAPAPGAADSARPAASPPFGADSGEVELLPDTFAPPGGVRVEQLLPYFLPPAAPTSRATYEQK